VPTQGNRKPLNYRVNIFGVFGNVEGRAIVCYANERSSKYLFGLNYIPANFDGTLIGSSLSDNWSTSKIHRGRVYSASLEGGNVSEERLILDNVLERKPRRLAIFLVHPYLTATFGRKSGYMTEQDRWGALGSIQVLQVYARWLSLRLNHLRNENDSFGMDDFSIPQGAEAITGPDRLQSFFMDERAVKEYADLVATTYRTGAKIVAVLPPIERHAWDAEMEAFKGYDSRMLGFFPSDALVVDFNESKFDGIWGDPSSFADGVHLSRKAADAVVRELDRALTHGENRP